MTDPIATPTHRAIEAVWRIESARVVGGLARMVRDVGLAEDIAQDAFVLALERWPTIGIPRNPGAWLTAAARHAAIDRMRRNDRLRQKTELIAHEIALQMAMDGADLAAALDDDIGDDVLGLMFTCCHPVLSAEARTALTLRLLGGLSTREIARAYLVSEATLAQRIVRAKKTLAAAGIGFEVPSREARAERVQSVLEVIYLMFNEGYAATAGEDLLRPDLCGEALRLGRILASLVTREPEVHALVALMELQASRTAARTAPDGSPVLLEDQDRRRWNRLFIRRGLEGLGRVQALKGEEGAYALQAQLAACHATALTAAETDWTRIAVLYAQLMRVTPSPVIELNRAVALGRAVGPEAGLAVVDALARSGALDGYHLLPSVRGDLLLRLGRRGEAREDFERAAELTGNERERALLRARAHACLEP